MSAPDRAAWLAERRTGIGGSDIAALLGLSPYKTQVELWLDKTGRAPDIEPDATQAERMHWGNVLEQVVAAEYAARTGRRVQRINSMLRHQRFTAALANIDRALVVDGSRARWDDASGRVAGSDGVLECKTAHALAAGSAEWGEPGTDEVPQHYWTQCQWYLGVTGLPKADLAVLFGGQKFAIYTIQPDAAIQLDMLERAQDWWERHVVCDMPPEPTSEADAKALWRSHREGVEKIVDADVAQAVAELQEAKRQQKALEELEQSLRDIVCAAIGEAEAITYMGRRLATWKANKASTRTDHKEIVRAIERYVADGLDDTSLSDGEMAELRNFSEFFEALVKRHTVSSMGARVLRLASTKE